ncbi:snoRNA binding protein [Coprinopsis cinerea okayama7|uniref:SnoRNA binding protein n=1 Tax=Coprinopsis cinerea (strain Okayama-7 / 130 / ATCC MYA-4618 / FGSC 9003) TaxID=240176 RepID=A8NZQ3_COPC7|nr:snoRNA binding protein [Coprinopsis cinerea okayama7\|eukprot:XP_001837722.2 snoRNA binding protein [Coprinopsis cinerea okayama7\
MTKDIPSLPTHSSAVEEKLELINRNGPWLRSVFLPIPGVHHRRLRIYIPNIHKLRLSRMRRKRSPLFIGFACFLAFFTLVLVRSMSRPDWKRDWHNTVIGEPSTLVFHRKDLQKIWRWEVASGHYPSRASIPKKLGFTGALVNPGIPPSSNASKSQMVGLDGIVTTTHGVGPKRVYLDIQNHPPNVAYPPRPVPGSVADLDEIMRHCDFSQNKYVRDCLEVLRIGGGLDNGQRYRREELDDWKYIYLEQPLNATEQAELVKNTPRVLRSAKVAPKKGSVDPDEGLVKKKGAEWEEKLILSRPPLVHRPSSTLPEPCDPDNPRIFHMFWTGPFTDKPYVALLSFLYTQNTGLHLKDWPQDSKVCRPQFWMWINPGPAAAVPNPNAVQDMFTQLKTNPWAAPFLHPRFHDVIHFKMWNTTEQLDGIPEIKSEWRALQDSLFNSGGHIINVKKKGMTTSGTSSTGTATNVDEDDLLNRTGSKSSSSYDRLSVILSDMARFVLCHRFGGVYLDADTIFLRDWEELWGWKGAFAYRWSRLPKYNTAVLRMNKNSALGSFLFRTALKNGLDFHPMTVSRYTADAQLEGLLLRLPDALFDSAWLNTEDYQRDRPPQPYFTEFKDLFETPQQSSASPQALGFRGFFRGAYSYHFHNFWWKPFDPARNWPDLGPRFKATEEVAHASLRKAKVKTAGAVGLTGIAAQTPTSSTTEEIPPYLITPGKDKRDLDWSTVLKRTFEAYLRGETPNMYGEWLVW